MGSKPASFRLTDPSAYDGKAMIYTLQQMLNFPPPEWQIEGLVPDEALTGLAGAPGLGKSMLALDWALSIGAGIPWQGRATKQGFALYIAAEGYTGLSTRARSWLEHHDMSPNQVKFGLIKGQLAIQGEGRGDDDGIDAYDALFERIDHEIQRTPKFIVIDTLARCIVGAENESEDMTNFLNGAERLVSRYKSSVLIVHHKNAMGTRERGHTAFRGAVGALFSLEYAPRNKDVLVLKNAQPAGKQRDAEEAPDIGMKITPVGDSAVLESCEIPEPKKDPNQGSKLKVLSREVMFDILASHPDGLTWGEWQMACVGLTKQQFNKRLAKLREAGRIHKFDGKWMVSAAVVDEEDEEE